MSPSLRLRQFSNQAQEGDRISKKSPRHDTPLDWVYHITQITRNMVKAVEFQRISHNNIIQVANRQEVTLSVEGFQPVRVLMQERHGTPLKVAKEFLATSKPAPLLWIFEFGFIEGLPWDPSKWHWKNGMGDAPFFNYSAKRGYRNIKKPFHTLPSAHSFISSASETPSSPK